MRRNQDTERHRNRVLWIYDEAELLAVQSKERAPQKGWPSQHFDIGFWLLENTVLLFWAQLTLPSSENFRKVTNVLQTIHPLVKDTQGCTRTSAALVRAHRKSFGMESSQGRCSLVTVRWLPCNGLLVTVSWYYLNIIQKSKLRLTVPVYHEHIPVCFFYKISWMV